MLKSIKKEIKTSRDLKHESFCTIVPSDSAKNDLLKSQIAI